MMPCYSETDGFRHVVSAFLHVGCTADEIHACEKWWNNNVIEHARRDYGYDHVDLVIFFINIVQRAVYIRYQAFNSITRVKFGSKERNFNRIPIIIIMETVKHLENVNQFMETVKHLWNVNQFMTKLKDPLTMELQTFYMQKCKNLSNIVELPQQNFGPSIMCSHCGSLWSTVDHQVRLVSGKKMSKSMKKVVEHMKENPKQKVPKVCAALAKKSINNEMNKLVFKCSICSKNTLLPFKKKNRLKPVKVNNSLIEIPQSNRKKKKKKSKDKTAGLNISTCTSQLNKEDNSKTCTKSPLTTPKIIPSNNNKRLAPFTKKSKKLNIERLKNIIDKNTATSTKSKSLHNFLAELY